ncbi:MAG: hypothetical protein ORN27_08995 [Rhodoluna sp.]|nr:hypothetical protein [Rhodoluna sp.]
MVASLVLLCLSTPAVAAAPEIQLNTPVVIVGNYGVGGSAQAVLPSDDPSISSTVLWKADGSPIDNGGATTLSLTNDLSGKVISATITLHQEAHADKVVEATGETVFGEIPSSPGSMTYMGESVAEPGCFTPRSSDQGGPRVGWPVWFSCNPYNTNFGSPATQSFAWYRNGELVSGATKSDYLLTTADSGQKIWATYKATWASGYVFTETKKMVAEVPYKIRATKPMIRGNLKFRGRLFALTEGWEPGVTLSYQWFRNYAPIVGATSRVYRVQSEDLDDNIQVLVTAEKVGFSTVSRVSDPVVDPDVAPLNAYSAYEKVFSLYHPTSNVYDLNYITSPTMTSEAFEHEKGLVQKAADFWAPQFTPTGQTIVYLTKDDTAWAEALIQQHPSWSGGIPGGIRSWIENKNCGFALAFMADGKQVFIQCVHLGSDHSINDDQVSIHEYTHWFQYAQNANVNSSMAPWLAEGQGNFYGEALGIAPQDPELKFINISLAGYASQWDIYRGYNFGEFRLLDMLQAGNTVDTKILLDRWGLVWDSYYLGSLVSEWLVTNYGHTKYVQWTQALLRNRGPNRDTERIANAAAFQEAFGFDFGLLSTYVTPYFAARSAQVRSVWDADRENQVHSQVLGTTQKLPAFDPAVTTLSAVQRDWLRERLKDQLVNSTTCNSRAGAGSTKNELAIFRARTKSTCDFISSLKSSSGKNFKTSATLRETQNSNEWGNVFVTFGN